MLKNVLRDEEKTPSVHVAFELTEIESSRPNNLESTTLSKFRNDSDAARNRRAAPPSATRGAPPLWPVFEEKTRVFLPKWVSTHGLSDLLKVDAIERALREYRARASSRARARSRDCPKSDFNLRLIPNAKYKTLSFGRRELRARLFQLSALERACVRRDSSNRNSHIQFQRESQALHFAGFFHNLQTRLKSERSERLVPPTVL